ncbi:hypothetical protein Agub_g13890, partial [Astrephomene gubernaculifera]
SIPLKRRCTMVSEAAVEAAGGAVGASIALAATYPLAIVSTWQALEHSQRLDLISAELRRKYAFLPSPIRELFIYAESRGLRALFAGLRPCLAATAISQAVYFYLYSSLRQAIVAHRRAAQAQHLQTQPAPPSSSSSSPSPAASPSAAAPRSSPPSGGGSSRNEAIGVVGSLVVAGLAGCGNVLATSPVWVVATQLQAQQRHLSADQRPRSAWQVAVELYREAGIMGFWKGVLPSLVMVSNPTLQYILYEWLMARLIAFRQRGASAAGSVRKAGRLSTGDVFLLTALAKLGATLVTYPMLLIKNRLQAINKNTAPEERYTGVLNAVATIVRREGPGAFFKGMRLKMLQTVLAAALLMSIKEQVYVSTKTIIARALALSGGHMVVAAPPALAGPMSPPLMVDPVSAAGPTVAAAAAPMTFTLAVGEQAQAQVKG